MQLESLEQKMQRQNIKLTWDEDAITYLGEVGYDVRYGARPMKRAIQKYVENPLAEFLLENTGAQHIRIERDGDELKCSAVEAAGE